MTRSPSTFLLVSSVAFDDVEGHEFRRLVSSLEHQGVAVELHAALRGWDGSAELPAIVGATMPVHFYAAPTRSSLARSRNLVLEQIADRLTDGAGVAFPDDDCWYPPALLSGVRTLLGSWDVVMGSYAPDPPAIDKTRFPHPPGELTWQTAYERTASVTQYFRGSVVRRVGAFDERFGVGARYPSGEDTDYLVRAIAAGGSCYYDPSLVVGHRVIGGELTRHFVGGLALLAKHGRRVPTARRMLLRRIVSGARSSARGDLPVATYSRSLAAAVLELAGL